MIHNLDRTIRTLLHLEMELDEAQISFDQPTGEWSSRISQPTLNLFLYDVRENNVLRRHQWQVVNGSEAGTVGQRRTPLFIDCFYLVSAWGIGSDHLAPLLEHELLAKCMMALARYPTLNPSFATQPAAQVLTSAERANPAQTTPQTLRAERLANGRMVTQQQLMQRAWLDDSTQNFVRDLPYEVRTHIAQHDVLTNPAEVWSALENQMKAGFSYVVTLTLDPWKHATQVSSWVRETAFVHQFKPDTGQTETLFAIGCTVCSRTQEMQPVANIKVRLMEPALYRKEINVGLYQETVTDEAGQFLFSGLPGGKYLLIIGNSLQSPQHVEEIVVGIETTNLPSEIAIDTSH